MRRKKLFWQLYTSYFVITFSLLLIFIGLAVYVGMPETDIIKLLSPLYKEFIWIGLVVIILISLVSLVYSRRISRPLEAIRNKAKRISKGDFTGRVDLSHFSAVEIHSLGVALNRMGNQLKNRLRTISEQKQEQEAMLSSMMEGVIAIDRQGHIVQLNEVAANLLQVSGEKARGRAVEEVIRIPELLKIAKEALRDTSSHNSGVEVNMGLDEIFWYVNSSHLLGASGEDIGVLLVFYDTTRMHQLENHRKEFMENISHELRTPLTSIKGFVETLLESKNLKEEERKNFLTIVLKHTNRLHAITEDLLLLSRIEKKGRGISLESKALLPILESALEACSQNAQAQGIRFGVKCPKDLQVLANPSLLEQALVNLLDNSIYYSPAGSEVELNACNKDGEVMVSVVDSGEGIAQVHLPRLFERFYRVDKSRSRHLGGTGLGLAIVKHIAAVHGGRATVLSEQGKGSNFSIFLQSP